MSNERSAPTSPPVRGCALGAQEGPGQQAVRYALLRTYRQTVVEQAAQNAERPTDDPDEQVEMLTIQRYMGVIG